MPVTITRVFHSSTLNGAFELANDKRATPNAHYIFHSLLPFSFCLLTFAF